MKGIGINGYGTIGKRVADAVTAQDDMKIVGVTKRTPDYEAKAASSLTNNSNIFSNLSATFYDYYYDTEVSGGWKNYSNSYSQDDPYKKLNKALAEYGKGNSVQIPLYLGNLWYVVDGYIGSNSSSTYTTDYNFYWAPNNASGMNALYSLGGVYNYSITGLSGKKLSNGMITHFDSNGTDQNGAPMALFDEDWLTCRQSDWQGSLCLHLCSGTLLCQDTHRTKVTCGLSDHR